MKTITLRRAFTLVEMLVVIAVIGILAGSLGLAMRDGDKSMALQSAQSSLSALVTSARAQAALSGETARVVVWGDPTNDFEHYLRRAAVMVKSSIPATLPATGNVPIWLIKGPVIDLPTGIYFVPTDSATSTTAIQEVTAKWASNGIRYKLTESNGGTTTANFEVRRPDPTDPSGYGLDPIYPGNLAYETIAVNPLGQRENITGGPDTSQYLAIAIGEILPQTNPAIIFRNPDSLRGIKINTYGIATLLNDKPGFLP